MPRDLASICEQYPSDTKSLNCDGKCTTRNLQALARFTELQSLSISCVGLTSFEGLPVSVTKLVAADNTISAASIAGVTVAKGLTSLDLAGNRIRTVDALACLKELKDLKALDLSGNPICDTQSYREAVFKMLDELEYLDGKDRRGTERDGDEEEEEEEYDEGEDYEEEAGGNEGEAEGEEEGSEPPAYAALVGEDPLEDDEEEYQEEDEDDDDEEGEEEGDEDEEDEGEAKGTGQKRKRDDEDDGDDEDAEDEAA